MKALKYLLPILVIAAVAVIGVISYQKNRAMTVEVTLTPEQRAEYESKVEYFDKRIEDVEPPASPEIDDFIEKARYQEYLGRYGDAIATLLDAFRYYENTSAGWNNIAHLYEKVGQYDRAAQFYIKLIDTFSLYRYYIDLAKAYYNMNQVDKAFEAYGRYVQFTGNSDPEFLQKILSKKK